MTALRKADNLKVNNMFFWILAGAIILAPILINRKYNRNTDSKN